MISPMYAAGNNENRESVSRKRKGMNDKLLTWTRSQKERPLQSRYPTERKRESKKEKNK